MKSNILLYMSDVVITSLREINEELKEENEELKEEIKELEGIRKSLIEVKDYRSNAYQTLREENEELRYDLFIESEENRELKEENDKLKVMIFDAAMMMMMGNEDCNEVE